MKERIFFLIEKQAQPNTLVTQIHTVEELHHEIRAKLGPHLCPFTFLKEQAAVVKRKREFLRLKIHLFTGKTSNNYNLP